MKTYIPQNLTKLTGLLAISLLLACGGGSVLEQKRKELEKLKSEQSEVNDNMKTLDDKKTELTDKISALEKEIAKLDTTMKITEKEKIVSVTEVTPGAFEHSVDVQGSVDGEDNVTLSAKVPGTITRVLKKTGDAVRQGEIIAAIDDDVMRSQVADMENSLKLAVDVYNKQKNLWDQKIGTEIQYLQAKNNKESLEAKIATMKEQMDMYYIKAPVAGTIDDNSLKVGQNVVPGVPYVQVVNYSRLKVKADISESYAAMVQQNNDVELFFPDINRTLKTKVTYVAQGINSLTRTFTVEIALPSDKEFRPNMVAKLRIIDYSKTNAFVAPINTIQQLDGKDNIFIAVRNGNKLVARKTVVKVGRMYNGKAEILEGLKPGDKLITTGYQDLNDNELIRF